jgi:ubiquinone/menaquinone biosynthesis C-methylase UbiE
MTTTDDVKTDPPKQPERYRDLSKAARYDRHLSKPGLIRRISLSLEMAAFKRAIGRLKLRTVLDAPCGTGRLSDVLKEKCPRIASLDSSLAMLQVYRDKHPGSALYCGDVFNLPFRDGEWDWVVCYRIFHHFGIDAQRIRLLQSIARTSREGVVFSAWLDAPFNARRGSRRSTVSRRDLARIVAQAGLDIASIDFAAWPFQPKCVVTCRKTIS